MPRSVAVRNAAQRLADAIVEHYERESIAEFLGQFADALAIDIDLSESQPKPLPQPVVDNLQFESVCQWVTDHPAYASFVLLHAVDVLTTYGG